MKGTPPNRIREIRKAMRVSQEELAERMGEPTTPTTVSRLESGRMELTHRYILQIARALNVTALEIIAPTEAPPIKLIPVLGSIPAGPLEEAIEHAEGWVPIPGNIGGARVFALHPKGDSMDLVASENDLVIFDPDDIDLVPGRAYAVRNGAGEATFKRYRQDPPRLEPDSASRDHKPILIGREHFVVIARAIYATQRL